MKIHKEINLQTSTETFYNKAEEFGTKAANIFKREKGKSQMSNLQTIVNTSLKVTDTIDYIKRQIGHGNRGFEQQNFGNDLIKYLYENLAKTKNVINSNLSDISIDEYQLLQIHLLLCRQFVNSMVIHYNYQLQEDVYANDDR